MTATEYQNLTKPLLEKKLAGLEIQKEWIAFRGVHGQYSPRVDIAVGPFSVIPSDSQRLEYDQIIENKSVDKFLKRVFDFHLINTQHTLLEGEKIYHFNSKVKKNLNARCFLAIEIENTSSKKHIMGSMINACSLGRIGIGVAYNDSVVKTFNRILRYLSFLKKVGKTSYDTTNFMILTKEQFLELLDE